MHLIAVLCAKDELAKYSNNDASVIIMLDVYHCIVFNKYNKGVKI